MQEVPRARRRARATLGAAALVLLMAACEAAPATDGREPGVMPVATIDVPGPSVGGHRGGTPTTSTVPPPTTTGPTTTTVPGGLAPRPDGMPATRITSPLDGSDVGTPVTITGEAATVDRVMRVTLTVKDTSTGRYWNPATGAWQDDWLWYDAPQADDRAATTTWSFPFDPTGTGASGLYQATAFAWDGQGTKDPVGHRIRFSATGGGPDHDWDLVWSDEFDGTGLDPARWKGVSGEYGTPYRLQHYTTRDENVRVEGGNLVLEAHDEAWGAQEYTSGMVVSNDAALPGVGYSRGNTSFRYGRFEVRARIPDVAGIWPAFWMRPATGAYGGWPRSGEIDVMEYAGPTPKGTADPGGRFLVANLHSWDSDGGSTSAGSGGSRQHEGRWWVDESFFDDFHTWAVEWEPGAFRWYVDGHLFHVADRGWEAPDAPFPAPFDQPFFLTLNLQVGGWAGPVADADLPARFEIDHVRVYQ